MIFSCCGHDTESILFQYLTLAITRTQSVSRKTIVSIKIQVGKGEIEPLPLSMDLGTMNVVFALNTFCGTLIQPNKLATIVAFLPQSVFIIF